MKEVTNGNRENPVNLTGFTGISVEVSHFRQLKKTVMLEYPIIKGYSSILYSFGL